MIVFLLIIACQVEAMCTGELFPLPGSKKFSQTGYVLPDNSLMLWARSSVNVDGMARAYHKDNIEGGGLINLCNGGSAYPADQAPYSGSDPVSNCARFNRDYQSIRAAGWKSTSVGAIHWFGVLGEDSVTIPGRAPSGARENFKVTQVVPVEQSNGSGFFVSPTKLEDSVHYPKIKDQRRYLDAETIPFGVVPSKAEVRAIGVRKGTFGVAFNRLTGRAVPFVVGDINSIIGESSFVMGRELRGLPEAKATRANVNSGHVDTFDVLWVFFSDKHGVAKAPYSGESIRAEARTAYEQWGGRTRLDNCISNPDIPVTAKKSRRSTQ
jgi:hypothetical protein